MRALPPPRKSRTRAVRRFLHRLYRIITLQFILNRQKSVLVRRRRTPFHFSSRKYKVKLPKRHSKHQLVFPFKKRQPIPTSTAVLGEVSNVEFKRIGRKRFQSSVDRKLTRRLITRLLYGLYSPRRRREDKFNIIVDM